MGKKKKNRKKELRHKAKVTAYQERVTEIREERSGKSDYIIEYLDRLTQLEKKYNQYLDDYVASEIEAQQQVTDNNYPAFEYIDYYKEVKSLGFQISRSELRVVPDIAELKSLIGQWKNDLEHFLANVPEEYANSSFAELLRENFVDDITNHFVINQDNLSALRNYSPSLRELIVGTREKYISQGSDYVLKTRRNR